MNFSLTGCGVVLGTRDARSGATRAGRGFWCNWFTLRKKWSHSCSLLYAYDVLGFARATSTEILAHPRNCPCYKVQFCVLK